MEYKISKFTTQDLVLMALLAGFGFIISFLAQATKALPGGGELLLTAFFFPLLIVVGVFLIRKIGTVIIIGLVFTTLTLPTPLLTLPGFSKYPLILIPAIIGEVVLILLSKYEKIASVASGIAVNIAVNIVFLYLFILLGLPNVGAVKATFAFFIIYSILAGGIGGFIGYKIYQRIKDKPFIKRSGF
jgi:hypothetical protein